MKEKKKWIARSLAGMMSISMAASVCPVSVFAVTGIQVAKDGTYTGTAHAVDGDGDEWSEYDVTVTLQVENGKFDSIEVTPGSTYEPDGEYGSQTYFNWAVKGTSAKRTGIQTKLTGQDATENMINSWDTVSGATYTYQAIKEAALQAIHEAPAAENEKDPEIDTTALENSIINAESKIEEEYTADSWVVFVKALQDARTALELKKSQEAVTDAANALNTAMDNLKKADVPVEKTEYVLMNIPYADFYAAELEGNSVPVDAVASATLNKTRTENLVAGSYHVDAEGTDISGITFPVKVGEEVDLSAYKKVTDTDSVEITVTNRGQTTTQIYSGQEALFENESYAYYILSTAPSYYKEVTVDSEGKLRFGKTVGTVQSLSGVTAELLTETSYGDYQLNLDGLSIDTDKVYAVIIGTQEGSDYGLRHLENMWLGTELAWCTGFTKSIHGSTTSSEHYESMMGQHINEITYYTEGGIYKIPADNIYIPIKFEGTVSVEDVAVTAGNTGVEFIGLPDDFEAEYIVDGLDVSVSDGMLIFGNASKGKYTLTVNDKKGRYASLSTEFILYTEEMPATYNNDASAPALIAADGYTEEQFGDYLKNISSVSVDGKEYTATGRGAVVIINEDGTLKTDAEPFAEGDTFEIIVTSTGYNNLAFTYTTKKTSPDGEDPTPTVTPDEEDPTPTVTPDEEDPTPTVTPGKNDQPSTGTVGV
ncbi:MAG: FMN-binding protein, partial [Oliverpabstia sp.]